LEEAGEAEEGVSAGKILDAVGEVIEEAGLVRKLPPSSRIFRARIGPADKPYRSARKLGPPPPKKAVASRMSAAGIPMFYGALDEYTAIAETVLGRMKRGRIISVGSFMTLEALSVLDLTSLKPVPSLFSEERHLRPVLKFLHSFVRDLSKPIKKDGRVHIEYVPTQIVTEYICHSFQPSNGEPIRGILYPSSRAPTGTSCVFFATREECGVPNKALFNKNRRQLLRFVRGSAKAFKRKPRSPLKANVLTLT
jgi:RES domain-containing protein